MMNEKDLHKCKVVRLIAYLINSGDLENILSDKFFSAKDGNYNFLFKLVQYRIDAVLTNKTLMKQCLGYKSKSSM